MKPITHDPDAGRRVIQCAAPGCDRTRAWAGRESAIAAQTFEREEAARARGRGDAGVVDVIAVIDREVCGPERRPTWKRRGA